jgi:cyclopropane fatty-acyl-phospholipid synthase-like methyltransferase
MPIIRTVFTAALTGLAVVTAGTALAQHEHHGQQPSGTATPDHMAHRFDDAEGYAKRFDDPARDAWQMPDKVIEALGLTRGMVVADIGAGTGYFAVRLAKTSAAPTVYGADIEQAMVDYMKGRAERERLPNLVPVLAGAESPRLPKPADLVLVVDTYHHIGDRVTYFRTLRASMTPKARLAIVDFRKDSPEGPPAHFRFEPAQITGELEQAGFTLVATHDFLPRQHFLVYAKKAD